MSKSVHRAMLDVDRPPDVRPTALVPAPAGVSRALAVPVTRALERLPDAVLGAMARGLTANVDDLAPGALFRDRHSSGCAVGVTLRELAPNAFQFGRLEFWLWHRWRRGIEPDVARRLPQLEQLQRLFDQAVDDLDQLGRHEQPAKTVGFWFAACARAELQARSVREAPSGRLARRWPRRRSRVSHPPRTNHAAVRYIGGR